MPNLLRRNWADNRARPMTEGSYGKRCRLGRHHRPSTALNRLKSVAHIAQPTDHTKFFTMLSEQPRKSGQIFKRSPNWKKSVAAAQTA